MKVRTSELSGAVLDWAVAKCEGASKNILENFTWRTADEDNYSTSWELSGPIIERELITTAPVCKACSTHSKGAWEALQWDIETGDTIHEVQGNTPLEASMRCYVASKLGEYVDVPDEVA